LLELLLTLVGQILTFNCNVLNVTNPPHDNINKYQILSYKII